MLHDSQLKSVLHNIFSANHILACYSAYFVLSLLTPLIIHFCIVESSLLLSETPKSERGSFQMV